MLTNRCNELTNEIENVDVSNELSTLENKINTKFNEYVSKYELSRDDEIDIFFEGIVNPVVHKPEFTKFVFEIFKYNPQEFISKPFQNRQMALKAIWDTILYEGKQRNWFN